MSINQETQNDSHFRVILDVQILRVQQCQAQGAVNESVSFSVQEEILLRTEGFFSHAQDLSI